MTMQQQFLKSILLLFFLILIVCGIYPYVMWKIGQTFFPFQANGSILIGPNNKAVGSKLIAQAFTQDYYFQPRPSAAGYDASASRSSALAASNYQLRNRITHQLGSLAHGENGKPIAPDIDAWFQQDKFQGEPHLVAQWASLYPLQAAAWVHADPAHRAYLDQWKKSHPTLQTGNEAVIFFQQFSLQNPGKFPMNKGTDIPSTFFDMWLTDHPDTHLLNVPADLVTTSASGLDPHISLDNALYQLDRIAGAWAVKLKRSPDDIKNNIMPLLTAHTKAPFGGLLGEKFVNVLEMNLALQKQFGAP